MPVWFSLISRKKKVYWLHIFIISLHPSLTLKWYEINVKLVDMQNQVHGSIGFATQSRIMNDLSTK